TGGERRVGAEQEGGDVGAVGRDHPDLRRLRPVRGGGRLRDASRWGVGRQAQQRAQPLPCGRRTGHAHPCSARGSETSWGPPSRRTSSSTRLSHPCSARGSETSWGPPSRRTSSSTRLSSIERSGYASRSSPALLSKVFSRVRAPSVTSEASTVRVAQSWAGLS